MLVSGHETSLGVFKLSHCQFKVTKCIRVINRKLQSGLQIWGKVTTFSYTSSKAIVFIEVKTQMILLSDLLDFIYKTYFFDAICDFFYVYGNQKSNLFI